MDADSVLTTVPTLDLLFAETSSTARACEAGELHPRIFGRTERKVFDKVTCRQKKRH